MTCAKCKCAACKRHNTTVHVEAPRRRWSTRYLSEVILVAACALSALVAIKFVAPMRYSNELELRVEQLEKHSVAVDSQYHKGLK
jgi:hypothetical protein